MQEFENSFQSGKVKNALPLRYHVNTQNEENSAT